MIRTLVATATLLLLPLAASAQSTYHGQEPLSGGSQSMHGSHAVHLFATENIAQKHCPLDTVVWLDTRTHVWHMVGDRFNGHAKNAAFVCEKEAVAAGVRGAPQGK